MATDFHPSKRAFDMHALRRLATWGASAALALTVAVFAGSSQTGSRRLAAATSENGNDSPAQKSPVVAQVASRLAESEADTRRLIESVRLLRSDRDRLLARIVTLERNLEDVTGSIKRQAASQPPGVASELPAPAASPATPARSEITASTREAAPPSPAPAKANPSLPPVTTAEPSPPAEAVPPAAGNDGQREAPPKADFGIDIGGAVSFDGLRALWVSSKSHNAALFEGLHPLVTVRENNRSKTPELRLIVGPIESAEAASRLCATLSAARRYCQPVAFEGQRLAQADSVPLPERKPPPAKPAPQAPKPAWPFR